MLVVGLTGSFGTGKSFVAGIFKSLGAVVIDADRLAHEAIKKGSPAYRRIVKTFGATILDTGGEIDRRKLGRIVFTDPDELKLLNSIVHPEVIKNIKDKIRKYTDKKVVVIDAPLLIEARIAGMADHLVVVTCPRSEQVARCIKKFGLKKEDVLKRIRSQAPLARKIRMADHVAHNGGSKAVTRRAVKKIWRRIVWR